MRIIDLLKLPARVMASVNRYVFYLAIVPMAVSVLIVIVDVIGRYLNHPVPASNSITAMLLALIIAFGLAHTQALKGNINMDIIYDHFPDRMKKVLTFLFTLMAAVVIGFLAWKSWPWVISAMEAREWVPNITWRTWPFKSFMAFGATLLFIQLVIETFKSGIDMVSRHSKDETKPEGISAGQDL